MGACVALPEKELLERFIWPLFDLSASSSELEVVFL
jgi:hypothetical protein